MDYTVLIHPAEEGGYWTEVPALPGCLSQGETIEEALANIREAIESHIAALREEGAEVGRDQGLLIGRVNVSVTPAA
jgi:predicted RNase H-like HicB family nuclease